MFGYLSLIITRLATLSRTINKYVSLTCSFFLSDSKFQCLYPIGSQFIFSVPLMSFCSDTVSDTLEICPLLGASNQSSTNEIYLFEDLVHMLFLEA